MSCASESSYRRPIFSRPLNARTGTLLGQLINALSANALIKGHVLRNIEHNSCPGRARCEQVGCKNLPRGLDRLPGAELSRPGGGRHDEQEDRYVGDVLGFSTRYYQQRFTISLSGPRRCTQSGECLGGGAASPPQDLITEAQIGISIQRPKSRDSQENLDAHCT
jgi:hypothetical protein